MKTRVLLIGTASIAGLVATPAGAQAAADQAGAGQASTSQVGAQPAIPPSGDAAVDRAPSTQTTPGQEQDSGQGQDVVVRGIRTSLAQAAQIKRNADQVVDSIVAEDIGKFPDPTVASALQRVPGVQVSVSGNNEIASPIIRGLGDILTTVNGREIFTGTGRGFAFQDLPAEALAGADVYKSNSANLIEGGVAGVIDLKLHRAFDFKKFTISGTARGTYAPKADAVNPTVGLLIADRWDTGIGEIGALVDVSYSYNKYSRQTPFNDNLRGTLYPVNGADGIVIPTAENLLNSNGEYQRPQANFSIQWRPSSNLEVYTEGLFAGYRSRGAYNYSLYDVNSADSLSDVAVNNNCNTYLLGSNGFFDQNGTQRRLCTVSSFTANNTYANSQAEAHHATTDLYLIAGGLRYDNDRVHANFDLSWQHSTTRDEGFTVVVGKPISSISARTDVRGGAVITVPGMPLADPNDFRFAFGLNESNTEGVGELFAAKFDTTYDVGGILDNIQAGFRFASRDSTYRAVYLGSNGSPGGDYATQITTLGLPSDFLGSVSAPGRVNNGASFLAPRTDYLLDSRVQDVLRAGYGLPLGMPDYQPERGFDTQEKTYASYAQAKYNLPLSGAITVDGLVGLRVTRTDRDIQGSGVAIAPDGTRTVTPVLRSTSDTDLLPNASARIRFGGGLQARATYAKAITRPDFASLNPGLNYTISTNEYILNSGSSGNPDLKAEEADNFDATLEYYFSGNGYLSAGVYYKKIKNRVTSTVQRESIAGVTYNISRPRNIGSADLKGLEVAGQAFFDFLPGALSGLGAFGNFTIADSKVTTPDDNLYGLELTGVSRYSYNAGVLYEKYGVSARVVYTYRSNYIGYDVTGSQDVRPVDEDVYLTENRGYGRLDFGLNYDITKSVTLSLNGTNVLAGKTKSYRAYHRDVLLPRDLSYDDSTYSLAARFLF